MENAYKEGLQMIIQLIHQCGKVKGGLIIVAE